MTAVTQGETVGSQGRRSPALILFPLIRFSITSALKPELNLHLKKNTFSLSSFRKAHKTGEGSKQTPAKRKEIKEIKHKEDNQMNTGTMELSLNEMQMINGGWDWKKSVLWGVVGTLVGASIGAQIGGAPGAIAGGLIGGGAGIASGEE